MKVQYVKRLRMGQRLQAPIRAAELPDGYVWLPWKEKFTDIHGRVIYQGFVHDLDGTIFPTFRNFDACLRLMRSVASSVNFLPRGTWLIARPKPLSPEGYEFCASIQALRRGSSTAAIQNVVVRPEFRRLGLGRALLLKAMEGFLASGCHWTELTVTALNHPAIRLYEGMGFETRQIIYREVYLE